MRRRQRIFRISDPDALLFYAAGGASLLIAAGAFAALWWM
jgi:hypothetical protein